MHSVVPRAAWHDFKAKPELLGFLGDELDEAAVQRARLVEG